MRSPRQPADRFAAAMGGYRQLGVRAGRRRPTGWFIVPLGGFGVLLMLSFTLIGVVMLRPWAGPDKTWRTHMNLTEGPYSNYSRTVQTFVSPEGSAPIQVWRFGRCEPQKGADSLFVFPTRLQQQFLHGSFDVDSSSCSQQGRVEFIVHGCANCHGLNAQGGTVAPPIAGQKETVVEFMARRGTGRMPAFSEKDLSPEHLAVIAAYLGSLEPITSAPTPVPATGATPKPTSPAPPLVPPGQITYDPTLSQGYLSQGKQLFQSKCSACHALPPTTRFKAFGSDKAMVEMEVIMTTGMARLSDEDAAKVIRYLLALRHDTAP